MLPTRAASFHVPITSRSYLVRNVTNTRLIQRRAYASNRLEVNQLVANTPLAKQLMQTRVWATKHTLRKKADQAVKNEPPPIPGDKTRINIVSDKLCDDVLSYLGESLEKHKGCDLVDLFPGAGLWSSKLSDVLQPRTHILMEPDANLYKPFLQPLLDKKGTVLIPKSGIIWNDLSAALSPEYLPHQRLPARRSVEANTKNDTLLVSCNIAFHPRKRFLQFESVALLLLHQFLDAIKTGSLFQKYGRVRMLVWARREDKGNLLPRLMQKRRRTAVDGELLCDAIHEVVGWNGREHSLYSRDTIIDRASGLLALKRMKAAKLEVPEGRATDILKQAIADNRLRKNAPIPGKGPPVIERQFKSALESFKTSKPKAGTADHRRMKEYTWRKHTEERAYELKHQYMLKFEELMELKATGQISDEQLRAEEKELGDALARLPTASLSDFKSVRDNLHLWKQQEPVLHWDRRPYEPLLATEDEFYPHCDLSLIDIQPKEVHPLINDMGAGSGRSGESFELIQKALWANPKSPIDKALDSVWPGAADWIMPRCPSFHDPKQGGININVRHMELSVRALNTKQWEELLDQWFDWPFRPGFQDLVARSQDFADDFEESPTSGGSYQAPSSDGED